MTDAEHAEWNARKGASVSLNYDDNTTNDGKLHGVIVGTWRAPTFPSNDRVAVRVDGRIIRVYPHQILKEPAL